MKLLEFKPLTFCTKQENINMKCTRWKAGHHNISYLNKTVYFYISLYTLITKLYGTKVLKSVFWSEKI